MCFPSLRKLQGGPIRPTKGAGPGRPYFTAVSGPAVKAGSATGLQPDRCSLNQRFEWAT